MKRFCKIINKRSGFTLVELIVVVGIIGVLAAIIVPVMMGYTVKSKVTSANKTASDIQKGINLFLTQAYAEHYGMFASLDATTDGVITVDNGQWKMTITDPGVFVDSADIKWKGSGQASKGEIVDRSCAENLLLLRLASLLSEMHSARIGFFLKGNVCVAVYYSSETDDAIHILPFDENGWTVKEYEWNGDNAGINDQGYCIGTAPVLELVYS